MQISSIFISATVITPAHPLQIIKLIWYDSSIFPISQVIDLNIGYRYIQHFFIKQYSWIFKLKVKSVSQNESKNIVSEVNYCTNIVNINAW